MAFSSSKRPGSDDDYNSFSGESRSFFGKSMRIEGEITSDENLTIEGKVDGQLEISKTLTIGKDGYVSGSISAAVVRISGGAQGRLTAREKLEITSEGKFDGHINAERIKVAEGAQLKGNINTEDSTPAIEEKNDEPAEPEKSEPKAEDNYPKEKDKIEESHKTEEKKEKDTEVIKEVQPTKTFQKTKNSSRK